MKKACPIVLRNRNNHQEILVFNHPLAGIQLVKGTVELGESNLAAAERELREEAGIELRALYQMLEWQRQPDEPMWIICMMEPGDDLPERWDHFCEDDGGHVFQYFWHSLAQSPSSDWHPLFVDALNAIRNALVQAR